MTAAPTIVHDIVCAFTQTELPMSWAQVHRRFEHTVRRAGLRVRVRLLPIEELPEHFEVLVVPPELAVRARTAAPHVRVIVADRQTASGVATELVAELEAGVTLRAEKASPGEPLIVTHRGTEIL